MNRVRLARLRTGPGAPTLKLLPFFPTWAAWEKTGSPKGRRERMADIEITQAEADSLIAMEKRFVDDNDWTFPGCG